MKISGSDMQIFVWRHITTCCDGRERPAVKPSAPTDAACWSCLPSPCVCTAPAFPGHLTFWYSHDLTWTGPFLAAGCDQVVQVAARREGAALQNL